MEQDALLKTDCINIISQARVLKKSELSKYSETSVGLLWVNYLQLLGVAQELVESDRTCWWNLHRHAISM